jgi:glycosyltransferase involved in cell wall biosynthesis
MKHPLQVSFVIPCYRSHRTIGFTLRSIQQQQGEIPWEAIVVDSSERPVAEWLRTSFPKFRVLHSERRLSPAQARNRGAAQTSGDWLAFLDADAAARNDWLKVLLEKMSAAPDIRLAGGSVANANPETVASRMLHWIEFSEFLPGLNAEKKQFLSSSNLLIRREDFDHAGGFPEDFEMSEDVLFSSKFPGGCLFEPSTGVEHHHRSRCSSALTHLKRLGFWSARARLARGMHGSALARFPPLAFLLPPWRLIRIVSRMGRCGWRARVQGIAHSPVLFIGLVWWSLGFYRGLKK